MKTSALVRDEAEQRSVVEEELATLSRLVARPLDDRDADQYRQDVAQRIVDGARRVLGAVSGRLYAIGSIAGPKLRVLAASVATAAIPAPATITPCSPSRCSTATAR